MISQPLRTLDYWIGVLWSLSVDYNCLDLFYEFLSARRAFNSSNNPTFLTRVHRPISVPRQPNQDPTLRCILYERTTRARHAQRSKWPVVKKKNAPSPVAALLCATPPLSHFCFFLWPRERSTAVVQL